jgi:hypothetical protein
MDVNGKKRPVEMIPGMKGGWFKENNGGGIKESSGGGELKYEIFEIL